MPEYGRRLDALQQLLHDPRNLVERRIETFTLPSYEQYEWKISQQLRIPNEAGSAPDATGQLEHTYIVSLGLFEKKRTPDLVARDGHGSELAILTRDARGSVMATALLGRYLDFTPYNLGGEELYYTPTKLKATARLELTPAEKELLRLVTHIGDSIKKILTYGPEDAQAELDSLIASLGTEPVLGDGGWPRILEPLNATARPEPDTEELGLDADGSSAATPHDNAARPDGTPVVTLVDQLTGFIGTVHVLAEVRATPGSAVTITTTFSDLVRLELPITQPSSKPEDRRRQQWAKWLQRWGFLPATLRRPVHNADHSNSFYVIGHPPDGVSIVRSYWTNVAWANKSDGNGDGYYSTMNESAGFVLSLHDDDAGAGEFPAQAWYDIQIRQETWLRLAWLQTLALLGLTLLVWLKVIGGTVQNITYVFGFPGSVIGALALTTDSFSARISLTLRRLFLLVAILALGYGLGFSTEPSKLPVIGDWPLLKIYNSAVGAYAAFLVVLVGRTAFGKRSLKNEPRSSTTTGAEIAESKRSVEQRVMATFVVALLVAMTVFSLYLVVVPV